MKENITIIMNHWKPWIEAEVNFDEYIFKLNNDQSNEWMFKKKEYLKKVFIDKYCNVCTKRMNCLFSNFEYVTHDYQIDQKSENTSNNFKVQTSCDQYEKENDKEN